MMTGLHLPLFALGVAVFAPRLLTGAGFADRCPRPGIAAWYTTLATIA